METAESIENGLKFIPKSTDVFITTYPKCGTTWVSFIAHLLRSGGNSDFEEIVQVVPWTITALDCGFDLDAPQCGHPRVFKSHENFFDVPKGAKYIYVARDPKDVCISFYHFLLTWVQMSTDEVSLEQFIERLFLGQGSNSGRIWDHYLSFYEHRNDENVLWLFYEDILKDRRQIIKAIAAFMEVELTDELLDSVMHKSSYEYMKEHEHQFDEHLVFSHCKQRMGLPSDTPFSITKVNQGTAGRARAILSSELSLAFDEEWKKVFTAKSGVQSYDDLRRMLSILR